jgi:hypothetical protein
VARQGFTLHSNFFYRCDKIHCEKYVFVRSAGAPRGSGAGAVAGGNRSLSPATPAVAVPTVQAAAAAVAAPPTVAETPASAGAPTMTEYERVTLEKERKKAEAERLLQQKYAEQERVRKLQEAEEFRVRQQQKAEEARVREQVQAEADERMRQMMEVTFHR